MSFDPAGIRALQKIKNQGQKEEAEVDEPQEEKKASEMPTYQETLDEMFDKLGLTDEERKVI